MEMQSVSVPGIGEPVPVHSAGSGDTVVYLHGVWDQPPNEFLQGLSRTHRVVAPVHLGFEGAPPADTMVDIYDAIYYHLDLLDALGLGEVVLVGHSLGGMFAAELAAVQPQRFSRLVLISPFGLWDDAKPVADFFAMQPAELSRALYRDLDSPGAMAVAKAPTDEDELVTYLLKRARAMATATRYLWPLPDQGLRRRAHRISAPTLVVWGAGDGVAPSAYAQDFATVTRGEAVVVPDAGHLVHLEQRDAVLEAVQRFLGVATPARG